ncbi:DUF7848 domain-containing protein [Actinacidiphila soli]|uniref:DUF7848 domain-containing protein n=1 Tax=Actinacidiphila soli TaxID=2487275 RepID=UPI001F0C9FBA|nr:hypothetical protein [Actinacidiphila soli]
MTRPPAHCLDWLPTGRLVAMRPAGQWWDAVRVPRSLGEPALTALGPACGAVIEDPGGALLYFLIQPGQAAHWQMPPNSGVRVQGAATYLAVPGPQRTGPTLARPPDTNPLPDRRRAPARSPPGRRRRSPRTQAHTVRKLLRYVQLTLRPEPQSPHPIFWAACMTCEEQSPSADDPDAPQLWCLQHAGRTNHEGFRCEITTHWRVFPAEGATRPRALP